jgi:hypothetical protein
MSSGTAMKTAVLDFEAVMVSPAELPTGSEYMKGSE